MHVGNQVTIDVTSFRSRNWMMSNEVPAVEFPDEDNRGCSVLE
jgi:hypothetical protein